MSACARSVAAFVSLALAGFAHAQTSGEISLVKDFALVRPNTLGVGNSEARQGVAWNGELYFLALPASVISDCGPWTLYATNGVTTRVVSTIESHIRPFPITTEFFRSRPLMRLETLGDASAGGLGPRLVITSGTGITISDGTTQGTRQIVNASPTFQIAASMSQDSIPYPTCVVGERVLFSNSIFAYSVSARTGNVALVGQADGLRDLTGAAGKAFWLGGAGALYVSDDGVTSRVLNVSSGARQLFSAGSLLYFCGLNGSLWRSDGTQAGTFQLTTNVPAVGGNFAVGVGWDGLLLFAKASGSTAAGLWVSDGTAAGTRAVGGSVQVQLSSTSRFRVVPGPGGDMATARMYFTASAVPGSASVQNVFSVDRAATAIRQHTFSTSPIASFVELGDDGNGVVYALTSQNTLGSPPLLVQQLDGSPVGLRLVQEVEPRFQPAWFGSPSGRLLGGLAGRMFYSAVTSAGSEPWSVLSTQPQSPAMLANLAPESTDGITNTFTPLVWGNVVALRAHSDAASTTALPVLWATDGKSASTATTQLPDSASRGVLDAAVFSTPQSPLALAVSTPADVSTGEQRRVRQWANPTAVPVTLLSDPTSGLAGDCMVGVNRSLLFRGISTNPTTFRPPLVCSDGTAAGTSECSPIVLSAVPTVSGSRAVLTSRGTNVDNVYLTDGTSSGTTPEASPIYVTPLGTSVRQVVPVAQVNGDAFVIVTSSSNGTRGIVRRGGLAGTDASVPASQLVGSLNVNTLCVVREPMDVGYVFNAWFASRIQPTPTTAFAVLGSTDGASAQVRVTLPGLAVPNEMVAMASTRTPGGTLLIFPYADESGGEELWVSDRTQIGTRRLIDILPGFVGSYPRNLRVVEGEGTAARVVFTADDGLYGRELWITDGTREGTRMLGDLEPGPLGIVLRSTPFDTISVTRGFEVPVVPAVRPAVAGEPARAVFVASTQATGFELFGFDMPMRDCNSIDFNGDGLYPSDDDLLTLLIVLAGGTCDTATCDSIDFDNDGLFPEDDDLLAFLRVFAGGSCRE